MTTACCPPMVSFGLQPCRFLQLSFSMMALVKSDRVDLPPRSPVRYWPSAIVVSTAFCGAARRTLGASSEQQQARHEQQSPSNLLSPRLCLQSM